jgi:predicted dithiol-disulfide oxidoreductase (DUF899 family)
VIPSFALEEGVVYHVYSTYDRGTDALNATWQLLDRAPKGPIDVSGMRPAPQRQASRRFPPQQTLGAKRRH